MTTVIKIIFIIVDIIFILLLTFIYDITSNVPFKGIINVPQGSATKIIAHFSKQNLNATPLDPRILSYIGIPQSGYIDLGNKDLTKIDFFYKLTTAKPDMVDITLIPGETTIMFLKELSKTKDLNLTILESEYNATAPFYEGFLIPETYHMARGLNEKSIISNLVKTSDEIHKNLAKEAGIKSKIEWLKVISKASVIQKEAADVSEMSIVSSVIDNRIKLGMKLQMDGTLNYGEFSHQRVTPERIRNDTTKFNTYIYEGLPQSPVCTVSTEAIKAALNPAQTKYLYFMRDIQTGKHVFTKTLKEHNEQVRIQRNLKK
ncbi:MAG: endolytic transglycosylase MltG [Campylobacter sp.]|nr:endolytic transglycosylase MltG [Campylobacter sp.]